MIRPAEIQKKANKEKVRDTQIEKDYILTWILIGVANNEDLSKSLAFKGGTALKKFYFKDYRYSEDLDFTLVDDDLSNDAIQDAFNEVFQYVREEANISLSMEDFGIHKTGNINFYISYVGPLGGAGANKRVKVDISRTEMLIFQLEKRPMLDAYSDQEDCMVQCYSLDEIMTEKMRSLLSRTQPRDYYDLWFLSEMEGMEMADHRYEFEANARHKGLDPDSLQEKLDGKINVFKSRWDSSMKDQIAELPPFEHVHRELSKHFRLLFK
ncbi:MAG: nucleotidyl transferase AbiEii/AbiGii toxin family protein [Syntrophomonadaceae bacterium]|nr:nucleotidyl transferase AbiEii/AbiGii toxin family protein [Syntrophomonadaceae bacterium]